MSDDLMPDQSPKPEDESLREVLAKLGFTSVSTLNDWLSTLNLPVQVTRNAAKALNRLCTAAVDVPVAYLEGRAARQRTLTEVENDLLKKNAGQIAEKMDVPPEYVHRAGIKFAEKIVREQINHDRISAVAMEELQQSDSGSAANQGADNSKEKPISDDFLNSFDEEARHKSSEEMQVLFGRILAGEIRKPGTFSIRTLKVLGEIEREAAILFRRLSSLCIATIGIDGEVVDARACYLGREPGTKALRQYGLNFHHLNILNECGLIMSEYNTYAPYVLDEHPLPFLHQRRRWVLLPSDDREKSREFMVTGIALSRAGRELFPIVDQSSVKGYTEDLKKYFASQNLRMVEIPNKTKK